MSGIKPDANLFAEHPFVATGPHEGWLLLTSALSMLGAASAASDTWHAQSTVQKIGTSTVTVMGFSFLIMSPFVGRFTRRRYFGSPNDISSADDIKNEMNYFERSHQVTRAWLITSSILSASCLLFSKNSEDREVISGFALMPLIALGLDYWDYRNQKRILETGLNLSYSPTVLWNGTSHVAGLSAQLYW